MPVLPPVKETRGPRAKSGLHIYTPLAGGEFAWLSGELWTSPQPGVELAMNPEFSPLSPPCFLLFSCSGPFGLGRPDLACGL